MDFSTIILIVSLLPYNVYSAGVLVSPVPTREGGSFLQYMTEIGENLDTCTAIFTTEDGEEIAIGLDVKSTSVTMPNNFQDETNLSNRLSSLGQNLCGFKVINVTNGDPEAWTLASVDAFDNHNEVFFRINVWEDDAEEKYRLVTVSPGTSQVISCGYSSGSSYSKDYCKLLNPSGEVVTNSACTYTVIVTMADLGKWRCLGAVSYSMDPVEFITELVSTDSERIESWAIETEDQYNIGCQIINSKSTSNMAYCVMTSPKGDDYVIRLGKTTGRYTTITTDVSKFICGMEIPKPLEDDEYGVWKCKIEKRGKSLYISNTTDTDPPPVDYVKHITVAAHLAGAAEIICEVPFASVYCHITTPYGEIFKPQSYEFTQMGQCIFSIPVVLPEHIGTWICAFAQEGQLTLDEIEVEVLITDLLVYNKELTVNSGKSLDIILKNSGSPGVPLRTCLCLTPQNISYYISETLNTSEVTYIGEGFNYGDCSFTLNAVSSKDFGNWTCTLHLTQGGTINGTILISAESIISETTSAIIITVSVVFGVALVVLILVVGYKLRQRRRAVDNPETVVFDRNLPQVEPDTHRSSGSILTPVHPSHISAELRQRR